jgi:DNA-binding transcriptional ArsR family regulator
MNSLSENQAAEGLAALGNPHRLRLFRLLVRAGPDGLNISDLQRLLDLPASTLAHHLAKLTQAGLVSQEKRGREVICTAHYDTMNGLLSYLTDQCCSGVKLETDAAADAV